MIYECEFRCTDVKYLFDPRNFLGVFVCMTLGVFCATPLGVILMAQTRCTHTHTNTSSVVARKSKCILRGLRGFLEGFSGDAHVGVVPEI